MAMNCKTEKKCSKCNGNHHHSIFFKGNEETKIEAVEENDEGYGVVEAVATVEVRRGGSNTAFRPEKFRDIRNIDDGESNISIRLFQ